jgi:hypothetical protein
LGSVGLFGGGPTIVWASDGSGILDGGRLKPIDGGASVTIKPDQLFLDRRVGMGRRTVEICNPKFDGSACSTASRTTIRVLTIGSGGTEWYAATDPNDQPTDVIFANDGQALFAMFEQVDGARHTAVIRRLDAPGHVIDVARFDLPAGGFDPSFDLINPADSSFGLLYWTGPRSDPTPTRGTILRPDGSTALTPAGSLAGWVPGPLAESWPGIGSYLPPAQPSAQP